MTFEPFIASLGVGLIGGFTSGLMGVSPGGALVVFSTLLLGAEQHVAQGLSLIAQVPPTSLSGIRRYHASGSRAPMKWLIWLIPGFLVGGIGGALAAAAVSGSILRWTYVAYLAALDALMILKPPTRAPARNSERGDDAMPASALLLVGALAGASSGFLGIGGGLALTVGLGAWLKAPRHQAQLVSLVLSTVPTTIPAAYVYWRQGWSASWAIVGGMILGLWAGTDFGARMATRVGETTLHRVLIAFVSAMALYMAGKALS
jgi:hypothetical protein